MSDEGTERPFRFRTEMHLRRLVGRRAATVEELLAGIRELPDSVLFHHTHHFLLQHHYLSPEPPNDFAQWAADVLHDLHLAEELASIDTCSFASISELRTRLLETLERAVAAKPRAVRAPEGEEFHFLASVTFVIPTPYVAYDLATFAQGLRLVTLDSVYYHMFESRIRLGTGVNDFSAWLERSLGEIDLAESIQAMDPYTQTLDELRSRILTLVERAIAREPAP
jgi:hypothetical protein